MKRIYTKKGDDGTTGLFGGRRVRKDDLRIEALGTIDELIAYLGLARAHTLGTEIKACQHVLYEVMTTVSGAQDSIDQDRIKELEELIDEAAKKLPPLTDFIIPGTSRTSAHIHVARTLARKAERRLIAAGNGMYPVEQMYLNRLSDYLFMLALQLDNGAIETFR